MRKDGLLLGTIAVRTCLRIKAAPGPGDDLSRPAAGAIGEALIPPTSSELRNLGLDGTQVLMYICGDDIQSQLTLLDPLNTS